MSSEKQTSQQQQQIIENNTLPANILAQFPVEIWVEIFTGLFESAIEVGKVNPRDHPMDHRYHSFIRDLVRKHLFFPHLRMLANLRSVNRMFCNAVDTYFGIMCESRHVGRLGQITQAMANIEPMFRNMFQQDTALDYCRISTTGLTPAGIRRSATTKLVARFDVLANFDLDMFQVPGGGDIDKTVLDCAKHIKPKFYAGEFPKHLTVLDSPLVTLKSLDKTGRAFSGPSPYRSSDGTPSRIAIADCLSVCMEDNGMSEVTVKTSDRPCNFSQTLRGDAIYMAATIREEMEVTLLPESNPKIIETCMDMRKISVVGSYSDLCKGVLNLVIKHKVEFIDFRTLTRDLSPKPMRLVEGVTFSETGTVSIVRVQPLVRGAAFTADAVSACVQKCEAVFVELPERNQTIMGRFRFGPNVKTIVVYKYINAADCDNAQMYNDKVNAMFDMVFSTTVVRSIRPGTTIGFEGFIPTRAMLEFVKKAGCTYYETNSHVRDFVRRRLMQDTAGMRFDDMPTRVDPVYESVLRFADQQ